MSYVKFPVDTLDIQLSIPILCISTTYEMIGLPPSESGLVQLRLAVVLVVSVTSTDSGADAT